MGYIESLMARNESIAFATHQHWIVLLRAFIANLLLCILIVAVVVALFVLPPSPNRLPLLLRLLPLILLLVPFIRMGLKTIKWWNESYIITNRRVIQTEGIINKHVIDSSLEKVNDVVLNQSVLGRMLGYGDVEIQTAAEDGATIYHKVAKPKQLKETIAHYRDEFPKEMEALHAKPAPPPAAAPPESGEPTRVCPFCAETIKAQAKVCRYCGRDLPTP